MGQGAGIEQDDYCSARIFDASSVLTPRSGSSLPLVRLTEKRDNERRRIGSLDMGNTPEPILRSESMSISDPTENIVESGIEPRSKLSTPFSLP